MINAFDVTYLKPIKTIDPVLMKGIIAPFGNWLKIIERKPTMFFRTDKETLCFGNPLPMTTFYRNPFGCKEGVSGILKFVCVSPEVTNDNLQV